MKLRELAVALATCHPPGHPVHVTVYDYGNRLVAGARVEGAFTDARGQVTITAHDGDLVVATESDMYGRETVNGPTLVIRMKQLPL